jgi:outer membrane receptor for ferric coprogen and ferric-rhodotorulic acid
MPFDLPAQPLALALLVFAQESGCELLAPRAPLEGRMSAPVTDAPTPDNALAQLLRGTGCKGEIRDRVILVRCGPLEPWTGA